MPTKEQVLSRFEESGDYRAVGRAFDVPAGQAYLIGTGLPADGGDAVPPSESDRAGVLPTSTQHLVHEVSEPVNPATKPHVLRWVKHRAEVDAPMRAAAQARDAAPGEVLEPEETDVATVLTRDHDQVTALLKQLKTVPGVTAGGSPVHLARRKSIADMITVALSKHEAAEQEHFWPTVRKVLPDGDSVAQEALSQEQEGKDLLQELGSTPATEDRFDELAVQVDDAARRHVAYEDRVLLRLGECLDEGDRRELGRRILRARDHAPTRPHPHAPTAPAAAVKAAGAVAAAADRVRDATGDRPAKRRGKAAKASGQAAETAEAAQTRHHDRDEEERTR